MPARDCKPTCSTQTPPVRCEQPATAKHTPGLPLGKVASMVYTVSDCLVDGIVCALCAAGVVVATIERANMLVTRLMEADPSLPQLGLVVVDELHLLGADNRGCALELLLNKLRYVTSTKLLCALLHVMEASKWPEVHQSCQHTSKFC